MSDSWHLPLAIGVAVMNVIALWLMAWWFQSRVETIVARHTSGLLAAVLAKHSDAERAAEDAKRVALTVHGVLLDWEKKVTTLSEKVERLHARLLELEGKQ